MIYTSFEMIRDCRAGRAEGWSHFVMQYIPVIRKLLAHYFPEREGDRSLIERTLVNLRQPESSLFQELEPAPERAFVAELRQRVLTAVEADRASAKPEVCIDLETLGTALAPLTLIEKLVVWFETMRYGPADSARMLRMSPATAEKIRGRGGELIRGSVDTWHIGMLQANGPALGQAAGIQGGKDCLPAKSFLDVVDGRATWRGREEIEGHVKNCWRCLDYYCRLLEAVDTLRTIRPLSGTEAQQYERLLGIHPAKRR